MRRLIPAAAAVLALGLAVFFQWRAQGVAGQMKGYQDQITLLQEPKDAQQAVQEMGAWQGELDLTFWGEASRQTFSGAEGYGAQLSVIAFVGSTELLFPCDAVLYDTDREGCLLDERAAEQLFGSHQVQGERIWGISGSWTVRAVLPLQEGLVVLPAGDGAEGIPAGPSHRAAGRQRGPERIGAAGPGRIFRFCPSDGFL